METRTCQCTPTSTDLKCRPTPCAPVDHHTCAGSITYHFILATVIGIEHTDTTATVYGPYLPVESLIASGICDASHIVADCCLHSGSLLDDNRLRRTKMSEVVALDAVMKAPAAGMVLRGVCDVKRSLPGPCAPGSRLAWALKT